MKPQIVYLEDIRTFQQAVCNELDPTRSKYEFYLFDNPSDTIKHIRNSIHNGIPIHLIITDFTHQGQNGYYFAFRVKQMAAAFKLHIPILLISMLEIGHNPLIAQGLSEKVFDAHLRKIDTVDKIIGTVEHLIASSF